MQKDTAKRSPIATLALIGIALGYQVWPVHEPTAQTSHAQMAVQKVAVAAAVVEGPGDPSPNTPSTQLVPSTARQ